MASASISYNTLIMFKKILLHSLFAFLIIPVLAQEGATYRKNSFGLELGKNGIVFNLIFDHHFPRKNFGYRMIAGSNFDSYLNQKSVGSGFYYLLGKKKHALELGFDLNYVNITERSDDVRSFGFIYPDYEYNSLYPSFNFGYRFSGKNGLFRMGAAPGYIAKEWILGAYLGFGIYLN